MTLQEIKTAIEKADIPAIAEINEKEVQDTRVILVKGRMYHDEEQSFNLYCAPVSNAETNHIQFVIPGIYVHEEGMPGQLMMACWLDAQRKVQFGQYRWDPDDNRVTLAGFLPMSSELPSENNIIEWALRNIIALFYYGHYHYSIMSEIRNAIQSKLLTEEQANNILKDRNSTMQRLLGLQSGEAAQSDEDEGI